MTDIVERLNLAAISTSEAGERWSKAKSMRQDHNPPRDDLYSWPTPEQTLYGLAASEITRLQAALVSIRDIEKPPVAALSGDSLNWYITAMQMAELADDALITAKPERDK